MPPLPSGVQYTDIAAGDNCTLGLRSDGTVIGWGQNTNGQLNVPTPPLQRYFRIGAGHFHSLGLREPQCTAVNYCTAKLNNLGCLPHITWIGSTSLSGPDNFFIGAIDTTTNQPGILIWSSAPFSAPFYGGTLCVDPQFLVRTPVQSSGGSGPLSCAGSYVFHFSHAYMASFGIGPGSLRYAQYWTRDSADPLGFSVGLTEGLMFMVCP